MIQTIHSISDFQARQRRIINEQFGTTEFEKAGKGRKRMAVGEVNNGSIKVKDPDEWKLLPNGVKNSEQAQKYVKSKIIIALRHNTDFSITYKKDFDENKIYKKKGKSWTEISEKNFNAEVKDCYFKVKEIEIGKWWVDKSEVKIEIDGITTGSGYDKVVGWYDNGNVMVAIVHDDQGWVDEVYSIDAKGVVKKGSKDDYKKMKFHE